MRRRALVALVSVFSAVGLYVLTWRPLAVEGTPPHDGFFRLGGVIHVHTTRSDGGGSPEFVVAAAQRLGLGFLIITDHNNLDAKPIEGYRDGVLVLVGTEVSTSAGHLLGIGIEDPCFRFSGDPTDALEDIADLGGASFAAHPSSARADLKWTGWGLPGGWGIEILNGDSEWREAGWARLLAVVAFYGLNPRYALLTGLLPPRITLASWDQLLGHRFAPGIVGADAHAWLPVSKDFGLPLPSYESVFAVAQNHVLLDRPPSGDAGADARAVVSAIQRGRVYVGLDALAPANGFFFEGVDGGERFTMGDAAPFDSTLRLRAGGRLPASARLVLLEDGRPVADGVGSLDLLCPGPGVYRVEVYVPRWSVPWILSNPIEVFSPAVESKRREAAAWPARSPPPADGDALELSEFHPEFDSLSSMDDGALEAGEAPIHRGVSLQFRLGVPTADHPHVSCAFVSREPRRLLSRHGLVFWIKADRPYRLWVQLRDGSRPAQDAGASWSTSVKAVPSWQRVAVPFDGLRPADRRIESGLDLGHVRMMAFVLDPGTVKAGTKGRILLGEPAVY